MAAANTDERLIGKLRERGQRVTSQRLVIHRVLTSRDQHISAEALHATIREQLPGTSLPTVYATLELFEQLGLTQRVSTGSGPALYDSRMAPHGHVACRNCGTVADLEDVAPPQEAFGAARRAGFTPEHVQLVVWGRCADCAA